MCLFFMISYPLGCLFLEILQHKEKMVESWLPWQPIQDKYTVFIGTICRLLLGGIHN